MTSRVNAGWISAACSWNSRWSLGFRSSFNFIPEGAYRVPPAFRDELTRNGFEVGVPDLKHDGRLFRSVAEFRSRAMRINEYLRDWNAVGFRSGFMLHNLDWLHNLDIEYDMSTFDTDPFEPQPDGRNTIFPFWVPLPPVAEDGGPRTEDRVRRSGGQRLQNFNSRRSATLFRILLSISAFQKATPNSLTLCLRIPRFSFSWAKQPPISGKGNWIGSPNTTAWSCLIPIPIT